MNKTVRIFTIAMLVVLMTFALCGCGAIVIEESSNSTTNQNTFADLNNVQIEDVVSKDASLAPSNAGSGSVSYNYLGYVYYGSYPQTIADTSTVKKMSKVTENGYYYVDFTENDTIVRHYYSKISSCSLQGINGYEFSEGTKVVEGATYYFEVEPIKWNVYGRYDISSSKMEIYLLSDVILDVSAFTITTNYARNLADGEYYMTENPTILANNWAYSNVRSWLNGTFKNKAFTEEEIAKIVARDTSSVSEVYNEADATESVFILDYDVALNYLDSKLLSAKISDYAIARGGFMSVFTDYFGNGRWWLSDAGNTSYRAAYVGDSNFISSTGESVGSDFIGVRPSICIEVSTAFEILTEE